MGRYFWKDGSHREIFPIDARLAEILRLLETNQAVMVEAETGAGKTTRIPQAILNEWPDVKVTVTQPRRPAVRWAARYIAKEMRDVPGGIVGWKLFGDKPMVSQNTRCVFQVDQSLANRIRRTGKLPKGVIIVDEAHERHISTDTLLIMLERLLPESPETKLIVTSATIDTKKFSEYFGNAPILSIAGRCYPVETYRQYLTRYEHHSQGAIGAGEEVITEFLNWGQLHIHDKENLNASVVVESGTVLIFLPGKEDIDNAIKNLTRHVNNLKEKGYSVTAITNGKKDADAEYKIEIYPCHADLSPAEQDRTQSIEVPEKTLRIVCTTDIARGSATFPQVVGVIDSLQVKRRFVDAKGASHLGKISVSKAEADQAKGRAGRTQPGFYIPIGSEYDGLDRWPMPAILREPLTAVILQLVSGGINPRDCHYVDSPLPEMIAVTIERLKKLGALDKDEAITEIGELLVQFPIDPENAKTLITAERLGVLSEAVISAACLDNDGIFFPPKKDELVEVDK
jgi:HrpA-like RNA helicase